VHRQIHCGLPYGGGEIGLRCQRTFNAAIAADHEVTPFTPHSLVCWPPLIAIRHGLRAGSIPARQPKPWPAAERSSSVAGDFDEALAWHDRAVELASTTGWIIGTRLIYRRLGQPERALKDLDRACELDDDSGWIFAERGVVLRELGRYPEAAIRRHSLILAVPSSSNRQGRRLSEGAPTSIG
jgi:tetratricopeptide (TPR) repeat protein